MLGHVLTDSLVSASNVSFSFLCYAETDEVVNREWPSIYHLSLALKLPAIGLHSCSYLLGRWPVSLKARKDR